MEGYHYNPTIISLKPPNNILVRLIINDQLSIPNSVKAAIDYINIDQEHKQMNYDTTVDLNDPESLNILQHTIQSYYNRNES